MALTLYGIPSCGTVKKARRWLDDHDLAYDFVDYRQSSPAPEQIDAWLETFGFKPMRNTSGGAYRALPADKKTWGTEQWRVAFKQDAMLLKRPVVERDGEPLTVGFKEPVYEALFGA